MNQLDQDFLIWFNGLTGNLIIVDWVAQLLAGDYLVPLGFVLIFLWLWFSGHVPTEREQRQKAVMVGVASIGLSNLSVLLLNLMWHRPRPFHVLGDDINLLFYQSTDSSFPANPVAVVFAATGAVWLVHRGIAGTMLVLSVSFALARMYVGVFYLTDIIAGAGVGLAVSYGTERIRRAIEPLPSLVIRIGRAIRLA